MIFVKIRKFFEIWLIRLYMEFKVEILPGKWFLSFSEKLSPLGNASSEDCANYIVAMFSDYTKKVTLQNLYNDGGYSSVGVSQEILDLVKDRIE